MILNFKEIPQGNKRRSTQNTFELFARDFLEMLGYEILQNPDNGADGKRELIVRELRHGISGKTRIKWLVSCRHNAHLGTNVSESEEPEITTRVSEQLCDGFLGFYSANPSETLEEHLLKLNAKVHCDFFDPKRIENHLFESPKGIRLAKKYFPLSIERYKVEHPKPAELFPDGGSIHCEYCDDDLLKDKKGIFVTLRRMPDPMAIESDKKTPYIKAYYSCKGKCDTILKGKYMQGEELVDEWTDITTFLSPATYMKKLMTWMNAFQKGVESMNDEVFEKLKYLFVYTFPYISREQTTEEKEKVKFYLRNGLIDWI